MQHKAINRTLCHWLNEQIATPPNHVIGWPNVALIRLVHTIRSMFWNPHRVIAFQNIEEIYLLVTFSDCILNRQIIVFNNHTCFVSLSWAWSRMRGRARAAYALPHRNAGKHNHVKRRMLTGILGAFYNSRNRLWFLATSFYISSVLKYEGESLRERTVCLNSATLRE